MQRASLRRVLGALGLVSGAVSGCGDDGVIGGSTGAETTTSGTTGVDPTTTGVPDTGVMTGGPTTVPTTGDGSGVFETTTGTTGDEPVPTTGDDDTGPDPTGEANKPPVAFLDKYITKAKQALNVAAANGLLKNDQDINGDPLTVVAGDPLTEGGADVTVQKDGSFTYVPPPGLWGDDSFAYKIWDGIDGFAMGKVQVGVTPTSIPLFAVVDGRGGFAIDGQAAGDASGQAVHHIGDINLDGFGDVVVGARTAADGAGKVYVVYGKADGNTVSLSTLVQDNAGYEILGAPGDAAGTSVGYAGDVNGDGLPDLIVGAPKAQPAGNSSGTTYVVFGTSEPAAVYLEAVALGSGGFAIHGAKAFDFSGTSARGAGDVNGDGRADVVVGAFGADPHGQFSGDAFVVFGRDEGKPTDLLMVGQGVGGGFVMHGEAATDFAGSAVAGAGDVNGDGLADVIVGAYGQDGEGDTSGRAYVVFGRMGVTPVELSAVAQGQGGFAVDGEKAFDQAAAAVAGVGDVNGDGLADVMIGSGRIDAVGEDSGRAYVVFGKQDSETVKLAAVEQGLGGGFALDGQQVRDYAGFSVDALGDVNGDGLDDVVIGAYGANPAGDVSGRAYVVFGKASTAKIGLGDVTLGNGGFALDGEEKSDYSAFAVGAAGDVNGDGLADVIDGAFGSDAKGDNAGRSYVVFGGDFGHEAYAVGNSGPDNLAGTPEGETFIGGRGDDTITGQGGADIVYTGAGKDVVRIADVGFRRIDMGIGEDTLELTGDAMELDLTARSELEITSVEVIDLGDGGNTVVLARRDLLALAQTTHTLTITGTQGSAEVDLGGGGFMSMGVVDGFKLYSDGISTLRIAEGLMANVIL